MKNVVALMVIVTMLLCGCITQCRDETYFKATTKAYPLTSFLWSSGETRLRFKPAVHIIR
jgi:hypothetical protein